MILGGSKQLGPLGGKEEFGAIVDSLCPKM